MDNIEQLKDKYIISKSIDCISFLLYSSKLESVVFVVEGEDGRNVFAIEKTDITEKAYKEYKESKERKEELHIDNLHFYNYCIKICKNEVIKYKNGCSNNIQI